MQEHPSVTSARSGVSADAGVKFMSMEKDILTHLASAARTLAIKGFSPDEAVTRDGVCSLKVHGKTSGIEGRIEFKRRPAGSEGIGWHYAITSPHMSGKSENGVLADEKQAGEVVEAFVSVFTTVASFAAA
ncbi:MAG TPA: hypothetical protein VG796_22280 [Verrucomicrobiales bacterium]|jgi:hypothetical protein|nr:hypothetical protein [Verrucomicrobiales bacterium]